MNLQLFQLLFRGICLLGGMLKENVFTDFNKTAYVNYCNSIVLTYNNVIEFYVFFRYEGEDWSDTI